MSEPITNDQLLRIAQDQFNDSVLAFMDSTNLSLKRLEHQMNEFQNEIDRMEKALEKKGYL